MFDDIITCPWKFGQSKDGVQNGALEIKKYIQEKFYDIDFKNYIDVKYKNNSNEEYHKEIFEQHSKCIGNTLCIGGDHSVAIGSVLASLSKNKSTCLIWIDAHPDINTFESSKSGNIHGMPLSFITGLEDGWSWVNSLNFLKFENLFYFGIRDIDSFEYNIIKSNKIKILENVSDICNICHNYDHIHISFDVDSLDPSYMASTGTKVEHGIELSEIIYMINYIKDNICTKTTTLNFDIVEYNPSIGSEFEKLKAKETINQIINSLF